ncbi:hypothetical protein [Collimonas antrihumi]|uniref:hypothetical protein n=1 Tax=Collimonas antrihumi TaxID=1940615 RepID=UPI001B8D3280|nr:hypothetical protein [Collimonas antrihumi]
MRGVKCQEMRRLRPARSFHRDRRDASVLLGDVNGRGAFTHTAIQRAMHIHPTVSELIPTLLGDLKPLQP